MEQKGVSSVCDGLPPLCAKYPWLVSQEEDGTGDQIFYTIHNPNSLQYRCRTPELLGKHIRGCFFGAWVILSDNNNVMWSLWNPSTSNIIRLPPLTILKYDHHYIGHCCCLSAPPDDPNSVILLTTPEKPTFVLCRVNGVPTWEEKSYVEQLKRVTNDGSLVHGLACCDGKVYALNTDNSFARMVLQVDIMVKDREVDVNLLLLGACPHPFTPSNRLYANYYLKGSAKSELFCVIVAFCEEAKITMGSVSLFKLDMVSINWEEIQGRLRKWDISDLEFDETKAEDVKDLGMIGHEWKEVLDLKEAMFFVDLARDFSVYYRPEISSDLGGCIHIRGEMGKVIHSYCLKDETISLSSMPCHVLPTSHVSVWECRLECNHTDSKQEKPDKDDDDDDEMVVRRTAGDEDELAESHLLNLPIHVLESVMEASLGVEYNNFRATCKRCHLAAPLIEWKSDQAALKRLQDYSLSSPWLMVIHEKEGFITFTDPDSGDEYGMTNLEERIFRGRISCSRFGWLLCYYDQFTPVLYNYFTDDSHELPDLDYCFGSMCFSAPPTSPDCMVVAFSHIRRSVFIHFVAGEQTWREVPLDAGSDDEQSFHFPTFFGRGLYALSESGQLYVFKDLDKEDYSWEQVADGVPRSFCASRAQHYLTKCDQHLLLVVVGSSGESVEVFKLNDSAKEWEKIYGLGRHMVYISGASCIGIEAKSPRMENKIYFPQLHSEHGRIVFYSLETCSYGRFNQENIEETLLRTSYELYPHAWIEPSWSLLH